MRKSGFILFFLFCVGAGSGFCQSQGYVEFDFPGREIKFVDFYLGSYKVNGGFTFSLDEKDGSLVFESKRSTITFGDKSVDDLNLKVIKRGKEIFITRFSAAPFNATGIIDLGQMRLALEVGASWYARSKSLEGRINVNAKMWGGLSDFFTSGYLTVEDGVYKGKEFHKLRMDFVGKPPLLNITDSKIVLNDGSIFEILGTINLGDFSNFIPGAEYVSQKVCLGEWQVVSDDDDNAGFRKDIDNKFAFFLNTGEKTGREARTETELRYNMENDNFISLEMQEDKTLLGFERRRDF